LTAINYLEKENHVSDVAEECLCQNTKTEELVENVAILNLSSKVFSYVF
jgi:hypothetical protein